MIRFEAKMREKEETQFGIEYIKNFQKENPDIEKNHEILEAIFKEHAMLKDRMESEERMAELVYQRIKTDLDVSRVRSGATEKNTLITLEILNTILMTNSIDEVFLTSDYMATPFRESVQQVEAVLQSKRTRKQSKVNE